MYAVRTCTSVWLFVPFSLNTGNRQSKLLNLNMLRPFLSWGQMGSISVLVTVHAAFPWDMAEIYRAFVRLQNPDKPEKKCNP